MKLWGGRFTKDSDKTMEDFHSSISFDQRLYREDIAGSIAHATMLAGQGIISDADGKAIVQGLKEVLAEIENGVIEFDPSAEDIHMNIEKRLTEKIGEPGKKLHTARSRNDQVALDIRLYMVKQTDTTVSILKELEETLLNLAEKHKETIMSGYTHLQKAQPVTFGHYMMAYFEMFYRDIERFLDCRKRMNISPLGSCALAGTVFPTDRSFVADALGMDGITANSLDGVADRDFAVEFLSACSLVMMHLSRFSEELILWSTGEFGYITMDDGYSTGSSIMPQKKNPDAAELVRGKTGRVYGDLMALLTVLKGIPLAYNKDMQEDKEALFDAVDTVQGCLKVFIPMISTMKVNSDAMLKKAEDGFINATDAADYLAEHNVPFREAHAIIGNLVLSCEKEGKALKDLTFEEWQEFSPVFQKDIYEFIDIKNSVNRRNIPGAPAPSMVALAIESARERLAQC